MTNDNDTKTKKLSKEERLFKALESIDWKLWEMYNMMKDNLSKKPAAKKPAAKKTKNT